MQYEKHGGAHKFDFPDWGITVRIDRVNPTKQYTMGNMLVSTGGMGVFSGVIRLDEDTDKQKAITRCSQRAGTIRLETWDSIIEQACNRAVVETRTGQFSPVSLKQHQVTNMEEFLLYPFVLAGARPTMIFARGGSLKTYLAGYTALRVAQSSKGVLVLDWETEEDEWWKRMARLCTGLHTEMPSCLYYQRMKGSLHDNQDAIYEYLDKHQIELLVVDSLGKATMDDMTAAGPAMQLFSSLTMFSRPALLIHHTNREGGDYGNVFYRNYVRLQWDLQTEPHPDGNSYTTTAKLAKTNNAPQLKPLRWRVQFNISDPRRYTDGDSVTFQRESLSSTATVIEGGSLQDQVRSYLGSGPKQWADIINNTTGDPEALVRAVEDMMVHGTVVQTGDAEYGLAA